MKNLVVYEVSDSESSWYYATLKEARAVMENGNSLDKLWLATLPPRKLAALLLNGESFVVRRETLVKGEWET